MQAKVFVLFSYLCIFVNAYTNTIKSIFTRSTALKCISGDKAAFMESILRAVSDLDVDSRYFFPGHQGGKRAPQSIVEQLGEAVFNLDVPELDGVDNIHSPEVSFSHFSS